MESKSKEYQKSSLFNKKVNRDKMINKIIKISNNLVLFFKINFL